MKTQSNTPGRPRRDSTPIYVWVTPEEKASIEETARSTGNSTSAFLRKVGLGYEIRTILDYDRAQELVRVNADLSQLGNLFKLWLAGDKRLEGYPSEDLRGIVLAALAETERNQAQMRQIIRTVALS